MEVKNGKYSAKKKWQAENLETIRTKSNKKYCIKCKLEQDKRTSLYIISMDFLTRYIMMLYG